MDLFWAVGAAPAVNAEALIAWWFDGRPEAQHDRPGRANRADVEQTPSTSAARSQVDVSPTERGWWRDAIDPS